MNEDIGRERERGREIPIYKIRYQAAIIVNYRQLSSIIAPQVRFQTYGIIIFVITARDSYGDCLRHSTLFPEKIAEVLRIGGDHVDEKRGSVADRAFPTYLRRQSAGEARVLVRAESSPSARNARRHVGSAERRAPERRRGSTSIPMRAISISIARAAADRYSSPATKNCTTAGFVRRGISYRRDRAGAA